MDGQTFQKALGDKAISLSFDAGHDYVTARLRVSRAIALAAFCYSSRLCTNHD